jgi:DNA-binding transcriptional LysR family regulator
MPLHMIEEDISSGTLVVLDVDDMPPSGFMLTMSAFHRPSQPPGPAGKWFVDQLKAVWHAEGSAH